MKVLGPKIWVITPKNEGYGFPWLTKTTRRKKTALAGSKSHPLIEPNPPVTFHKYVDCFIYIGILLMAYNTTKLFL